MKPFIRFAFLLALALPLMMPMTGCSYFDRDEDLDAPVNAEETIDLTNAQESAPAEPATPVVSDRFNGTTYSMDPSVEIFPLDDDMARVLPQRGASAAPQSSAVSVTDLQDDAGSASNVVSQNGAPAVIYFEHGSTRLNNDARRVVEQVAAASSGALAVEGHASTQSSIEDPIRRKVVNLKVSMDRALSVARALIDKGVPPDSITTVAHGEARPGATPDQSRRVEVYSVSR